MEPQPMKIYCIWLVKVWKQILRPCKLRMQDDQIYYLNTETGTTSWDHPQDNYYRDLIAAEKREKRKERKENQGHAQENDPTSDAARANSSDRT